MPVDVRPYDPAWPALAAAARRELEALPGLWADMEHIGSTSVPGLAAKPVVDLLAAVDDLAAVASRDDVLAGLGYTRRHAGMPDRLFYRRGGSRFRRPTLHYLT